MLNSSEYSIPKVQRAVVLQGGGALGAYQAGIFKGLYEKIKRIQSNDDSEKDDAPLFDIIAGKRLHVSRCNCYITTTASIKII